LIKAQFKRGFKAKAEKLSVDFREKLKLKPWEPLCAYKLAEYLNISLYPVTEFLNEDADIKTLKLGEWSALTMITQAKNRIIINNPFNSPQRQQSDLMHELAHIICNHKRDHEKYDFNIPFGMHEYDEIQENEAIFLGGALQLSKACLFWSLKRDLTFDEIANTFNSSRDMVNYRMNVTGIGKTGKHTIKLN